MSPENVLQRLNDLLRTKGYSTYRLAKESGVPVSTINNLFSNDRIPTIITLYQICNGLDITLGDFFSDNLTLNELTPQQRQILYIYNNLSEEQQAEIRRYIMEFIPYSRDIFA